MVHSVSSYPTPCSGDFRDASVDIAHFFTPVEKVGLGTPLVGAPRSVLAGRRAGHFTLLAARAGRLGL